MNSEPRSLSSWGPLEKIREMDTDPYRQGQLTMVRRNARRLLNMVNQLLDFRKLEEHELKLNCSEDDIIPFIGETAESFRDIAERKNIHFTFHSLIDSYYTVFDKDKIERILFNLLGNAFKFTAREGKILLELRQSPVRGGLTIVITDTGIGMSADEQQRIFDRFFQGDMRGGILNQGSGIGLSITREFVRLHGGSITVESMPGKGSVFTVDLPLEAIPMATREATREAIRDAARERPGIPVAPDKQTLTEEPPLPVGQASGLASSMKTLLLVEDNEDFRSYLKDNLSAHYRIIEAADGKEGWQKAISRHPDIIVSDISMPIMDGIQLSQRIRSDKRVSHIPVILLTALAEDAWQLKGLQTGATDYLTKPFNFEILNVKIRNLVMLNHRLRETYSRRLNIDTPASELQSEDEKLVLSLTQYIESNLDSPDLSVEDLCKHFYMSHASIYRKIVDLTGETPVEFIRSIKLNKAAQLLESSSMKIAEIGYAVGFTSPNYFTRAFKAKFNISPSEYICEKRSSSILKDL